MNIKIVLHDQGFPFSKAERLGEYLSIPPNILQELKYDHKEADRLFSCVIQHWLNNEKNCSWIKLAEALEYCDHKNIAEYIRKEVALKIDISISDDDIRATEGNVLHHNF